MVAFLYFLIPYCLLFYIILKARSEPIFLLGIPFLQLFYMPLFTKYLLIFQKPGSFNASLRGLIVLMAISFTINHLIRVRFVSYRNIVCKRTVLVDIPIYALITILILHLFIGFTKNLGVSSMIDESKPFTYMLIGFFLIKNILTKFNSESHDKLLKLFVYINSFSALLFILHQGFGITIYPFQEYFSTTIGLTKITRSFSFMPPILFFSIAYLSLKPRLKLYDTALLALNILAVIISFTRSLIITAGILILLCFIFRQHKHKPSIKITQNYLYILCTLLLSFVILIQFLPARYQFLLDRFNIDSNHEASSNPLERISNIQNVKSRTNRISSSLSLLIGKEKIFGLGFPSQYVDQRISYSDSSDSSWVIILIKTGILGGIIFLALYLLYIYYGLKNSSFDSVSVALSIALIGSLITSFISGWELFHPHHQVLSLWMFAFLRARIIK